VGEAPNSLEALISNTPKSARVMALKERWPLVGRNRLPVRSRTRSFISLAVKCVVDTIASAGNR